MADVVDLLERIADAFSKGRAQEDHGMRIPADRERDGDFICWEGAREIRRLRALVQRGADEVEPAISSIESEWGAGSADYLREWQRDARAALAGAAEPQCSPSLTECPRCKNDLRAMPPDCVLKGRRSEPASASLVQPMIDAAARDGVRDMPLGVPAPEGRDGRLTERIRDNGTVEGCVVETHYRTCIGAAACEGYLAVYADDGLTDIETRVLDETLRDLGYVKATGQPAARLSPDQLAERHRETLIALAEDRRTDQTGEQHGPG